MLAVIAAFIVTRRGPGPARSLDLATFEQHLAADEVRTVTLLDQDHVVQGELTDGTEYKARFPEQYTDELTREIRRADVASSRSTASRRTSWSRCSSACCRSCSSSGSSSGS